LKGVDEGNVQVDQSPKKVKGAKETAREPAGQG